ncbi:hypothetical protein MC7420_6934 [Coleofasciculus chthonoplastes PCC 7420]|uniref:Uncharacterized protein n=1 Tax=Coleofasciculus chthonoplastes PCC 7420 TaxID=118168 RepID=B4W1V1_9CYAN|nr:hypothetical protein MC7420_6934 [Coleofasciculus chthonoplastes PCC 7420]
MQGSHLAASICSVKISAEIGYIDKLLGLECWASNRNLISPRTFP